MHNFIELQNVTFEYKLSGFESLTAVDNVSMVIPKGSHVAVLGRNGSGKSTLARLINGIETPAMGRIFVDGIEHDGHQNSMDIRRKCGIVFQNPDNQIIGTTVEEDVAFGPENLGVPREQMIVDIKEALEAVGLYNRKKIAPHLLSGGQKQKLAIAGILAMKPECIILDESTSMLDPFSRRDFIELIQRLIKERNITVINITHDMEEAILADYVYVMSMGAVVSEGKPSEIFSDVDMLRSHGLDVPVHIDICKRLESITNLMMNNKEIFTVDGAIGEIKRASNIAKTGNFKIADIIFDESKKSSKNNLNDDTAIKVKNLSYTYAKETVFRSEALKDVSFEVKKGELFGIVGHTGSGKSTLVTHLNGLIRPQIGEIRVFDMDTSKKSDIREIRKTTALLFQYPEHQLFETSVFKDVAFGPKNLGYSETEINESVTWALKISGIAEESFWKSPFELSGGQKRRVAIAGLIAMKPKILILDEPAAGLDPAGRDELLSFITQLSDTGTTVILVSHNMDDIARMADRVLVLKNGEMMTCVPPDELFGDFEKAADYGIGEPVILTFTRKLKTIFPDFKDGIFSASECAVEIARCISEGVR